MQLNVRGKIIAVGILPLITSILLVLAVALTLFYSFTTQMSEQTKQLLLEQKRQEIQQYTELAYSMAMNVAQSGEGTDEQRRQQAIKLLRAMAYGKDGYIFVYDTDGVRIVSGSSLKGVGENFIGFKDPTGKPLIKDLIVAAQNGGGFVEYSFARPGTDIISPKISYAKLIPKWNWMIGTGLYVYSIDDEINKLHDQMDQLLATTMWSVIGGAAILLVIITMLVRLLATSISKPLIRTANLMHEISSGDGDLTARLPSEGRDELGQLGRSFNALVEQLNMIMRNIRNASTELDKASTDMLNDSQTVAGNISQQRRETEMVATAMNEMSTSVQEVARNAQQAAHSTDQATQHGKEAQDVVDNMTIVIQQLAEQLNGSSHSLADLGNDVESITSVLEVIQGVAEQTNLLALNAAIEAARAGEQGRGFAVVADEVRALASRTQDATAEIQSKIETLQRRTKITIDSMEASKQIGNNGVEQAKQTNESLEKLIAAINSISQMATHIATAAEQQSAVTSEINQNVSNIADAVASSEQLTQRSAGTSSSLQQLTVELNDQVNRFKLSP